MQKVCVICQSQFETKTRSVTCSDACWSSKTRLKSRQWSKKNPEKVKEMNRRAQTSRQLNGKFEAYRKARRSSKAGYIDRFLERVRKECPGTDISRKYLEGVFGDTCAVTSVPFCYDRTVGSSFINPYAPSIDRIDSRLPYQVGNIQIVLAAVNFAKNAMSMEDFKRVWADIAATWPALTGK